MEEFKLKEGYKTNEILRGSFNKLAFETFGIDFEKWHRMGYWDENYITISLIHKGRIVSNVSVNKMELIISGKSVKALQIGTVMTEKSLRGRGCAGRLIKYALEKYKDESELIFLFPNEDALDFYKKFGFTLIYDKKYSINKISNNNKNKKAVKLNIDSIQDRIHIEKFLNKSVPQSDIFDVSMGRHIRMWYYVYELKDDLFYLPQTNSVISFRIDGETLNIFDVLSESDIDLNEIIDLIATVNTNTVNFYFTPKSSFSGKNRLIESRNNPFMFISKYRLSDLSFSYPMTFRA